MRKLISHLHEICKINFATTDDLKPSEMVVLFRYTQQRKDHFLCHAAEELRTWFLTSKKAELPERVGISDADMKRIINMMAPEQRVSSTSSFKTRPSLQQLLRQDMDEYSDEDSDVDMELEG